MALFRCGALTASNLAVGSPIENADASVRSTSCSQTPTGIVTSRDERTEGPPPFCWLMLAEEVAAPPGAAALAMEAHAPLGA